MDFCGRLGGEEFVAVLPETGLETAEIVAERLRVELNNLPIPAEKDEIIFSSSFGVTEVDLKQDMSLDDTLKRADNALYRAKEAGRNRVVSTRNPA